METLAESEPRRTQREGKFTEDASGFRRPAGDEAVIWRSPFRELKPIRWGAWMPRAEGLSAYCKSKNNGAVTEGCFLPG